MCLLVKIKQRGETEALRGKRDYYRTVTDGKLTLENDRLSIPFTQDMGGIG